MRVMDIKRFAVHDGDGIRTTVFLKGCPLRCKWCHNPEGLQSHPQIAYYAHKCVSCGNCADLCKANVFFGGIHTYQRQDCIACGKCEAVCPQKAFQFYGREYTAREVLDVVMEDVLFYEASNGGMTLSGGECLLQADACRELLVLAKERGLNTAVDTCGCVPWEHFEKVLPYTDTFLYDVKAFDEAVHKRCTGVSNQRILENLRKLDEHGARIEIRIPYVPGYNDDQMEKIAAFLAELDHITRIKLLPVHTFTDTKYGALGYENPMQDIVVPAAEEMERAREVFASKGLPVIIG